MSEREFEAYLNLLARTLKLSEAQRQRIAGELRDHLEERMAELIEDGVDRDDAILQALDEFGDANVLAHDLSQPRKQIFRRKLMQTSFATIAAAALIALAVTYLLPTNYQGAPTQPQASADNAEPDSTPSSSSKSDATEKDEAGFVYIMGQTSRPGAYTVPGKNRLTLQQLIASSGGLADQEAQDELVLKIVRQQGTNTEVVTTLSYQEAMGSNKSFYLEADDLIRIEYDQVKLDERAPELVTIDLMPILRAALEGEDLDNLISSDWTREQEALFASHMADVLIGMGHERDLKTVSAWMGLMTVVGSPAAIEDAEMYISRMQQALNQRSAQPSSESKASGAESGFGTAE